jgi:hypothetical protein
MSSNSLIIHHKNDGFFGKLITGNDLALDDVLKKSKELGGLESIDSKISSITFAGHSAANLFSQGQNVSSNSPQQLADEIAKKYEGSKTNLTEFYLLSCEAGLSINEKPSFAEEFAKKMFDKGFTALKVHAFTNPISQQPMTGMLVQTHGVIDEDVHVSSWCYKSPEDENRDRNIERQIVELEKKIELTRQPSDRRDLRDGVKSLREEQEKLRIYVCNNKKYMEAMNQPSNTFVVAKNVKGDLVVSRTPMTEEVARAIKWLKDRQSKFLLEEDPDRAYIVQEAIRRLETTPNQDIEGIIKTLEKAKIHEDSRLVAVVGLQDKTYNRLKEECKTFLQQKTGTVNEEISTDTKPLLIPNIKDYGKILKDFFIRLFIINCDPSFYRPEFKNVYNQFTNAIDSYSTAQDSEDECVTALVKKFQEKVQDFENRTQIVQLENNLRDKNKEFKNLSPFSILTNSKERSTISDEIKKIKKSIEIINSDELVKYRSLKSMERQLERYSSQSQSTQQSLLTKLKKLDEPYFGFCIQQILASQNQVKTTYDHLVSKYEETKNFLTDKINLYLIEKQNLLDPMHVEKKEVMTAMLEYLKASSGPKEKAQEKWGELNTLLNNPEKKLWHAGWVSEVKVTQLEVEQLAENKGHKRSM